MLINKILFLTCLFLSSQLVPSAAEKQFTAYFESWSEKWGGKGSDLTLAKLPPYVNTVILSFLQPDNHYAAGSMKIADAGLKFSSDGKVVKEAIDIAKKNGAKVLVAVGGASYKNWKGLNEAGIAAVVKDFGLDGVDIDYEPDSPGCTHDGGQVKCSTDQEFQDVVNRIRKVVPKPAILSAAGWSTGAYGEGDFQSAKPDGPNTGLCVNMLKSEAGKCLDQVNIMSYDAGPDFDPKQAFDAYKKLFGGKLTLGLEIPPEAWGGHCLSMDEVNGLSDYVNQKGGGEDGMMLWSLQKKAENGPDPTKVSQAVCQKLGKKECDKPLPTNLGIETDDISVAIATLNSEKDAWVEYTFGKGRDEELSTVQHRNGISEAEVIAALDTLQDALIGYFTTEEDSDDLPNAVVDNFANEWTDYEKYSQTIETDSGEITFLVAPPLDATKGFVSKEDYEKYSQTIETDSGEITFLVAPPLDATKLSVSNEEYEEYSQTIETDAGEITFLVAPPLDATKVSVSNEDYEKYSQTIQTEFGDVTFLVAPPVVATKDSVAKKSFRISIDLEQF